MPLLGYSAARDLGPVVVSLCVCYSSCCPLGQILGKTFILRMFKRKTADCSWPSDWSLLQDLQRTCFTPFEHFTDQTTVQLLKKTSLSGTYCSTVASPGSPWKSNIECLQIVSELKSSVSSNSRTARPRFLDHPDKSCSLAHGGATAGGCACLIWLIFTPEALPDTSQRDLISSWDPTGAFAC